MGQPIVLSFTSPFPDESLWEGAEYERKWHVSRATTYFEKAETEVNDALYYYFWGAVHTLISLPYYIPYLNCLIYAINYLFHAVFSPECMQESLKEALNNRNFEGAYLMYERGVDQTVTSDNGETLVDLYVHAGVARERSYQLIEEGCPFNIQSEGIETLFWKAVEERPDIALNLLEQGLSLNRWKMERVEPTPPPSTIPAELSPFLKENNQPCVGRLSEKQQIERIFLQRFQNIPLLIGPKGIGKSSLANGCSEKQALSVNLKMLKGAPEDQVLAFKRYVFSRRDELVLVLEDLDRVEHDYLERFCTIFEELQMVGCSRAPLPDCDFFTPIELTSPSGAELIEIARARFPEVKREVIESSIPLCRRYVVNAALPAALLTTLDKATAFLQTQESHGSMRRQRGEDVGEQEVLELELRRCEEKLALLQRCEVDVEHPIYLQTSDRISTLTAELEEERLFYSEVTTPLVKHLLNHYIPPPDIVDYFQTHLLGQNHVIEAILPEVFNAAHGNTPLGRAQGRFLFVGLSGTGKTECAKVIAKYLGRRFVHIDMTKYREAHLDSTLVGTGAGYVGYEQGGLIQNEAKKGPMVLLLDEADKAHPKVLDNLLLHLLDEGKMLDPVTREEVLMHNVFVILSTNLGSRAVLKAKNPPSGFFFQGDAKNVSDPEVMEELTSPSVQAFLSPPLMGRLQTIYFTPLSNSNIQQITDKFLEKEKKRTEREYGKTLVWGEDLSNYLDDLANDLEGARPIREMIQGRLRYHIHQLCEETDENEVEISLESIGV